MRKLLFTLLLCLVLGLTGCQGSQPVAMPVEPAQESAAPQTLISSTLDEAPLETTFVAEETKTAMTPQYEDQLYLFYREKPFNRGVVKENTKVRLLPQDTSNWVFDGTGFLVDVIAAAEVRGSNQLWLLVRFTVWDALQTDFGWLPSDCVLPYTEENQQYLLEPLTIQKGADVFNISTGKVVDADFIGQVFLTEHELDSELFSSDYVAVGSVGGWTGAVAKDDLIYPELTIDQHICE